MWQLASGAGAERIDSARAALDAVFGREAYRWQTVTEREGPVSPAIDRLVAWFGDHITRYPAAVDALKWILVALFALVLIHAAREWWRTVRAATGRSERPPRAAMAALDATWFSVEADRLVRAGHYAEAMHADFIRLMLDLDERNVLRFHASKTPAELARGAQQESARIALNDLVRTLYRHAFAREACGPDEYAAWRARTATDRYAAAH